MNSLHTNHLQSFQLPSFADHRGTLTVADLADLKATLGFETQRVFWITQVNSGETRGTHAHKSCWEALLAVSGGFKLKISNGHESWVEMVKADGRGVVIPPMFWCELYEFAPETVCLCLASEPYDEAGYLKDYDDFIHYVRRKA